MLQDGWVQEGLAYVEKAKLNMAGSVEDYFLNEMHILNHDKELTQQGRNSRFLGLIRHTQTTKPPANAEGVVGGKLNILGVLVGP